ncbi:SHP2/SHP3 family peptide pheromone [Streptococcus pseudopneumoniae]|nr:SHP2/SHP3 family peptide pheromone [Streptococcus pseudopneumoniae]
MSSSRFLLKKLSKFIPILIIIMDIIIIVGG